jgi:hypothetical protein
MKRFSSARIAGALLLSARSGDGPAVSTPTAAGSIPSKNSALVKLSIKVPPQKGHARKRGRHYVSPATASLTYSGAPGVGSPVYGVVGYLTCTISIPSLVPDTAYTVSLPTWDATGGPAISFPRIPLSHLRPWPASDESASPQAPSAASSKCTVHRLVSGFGVRAASTRIRKAERASCRAASAIGSKAITPAA